jgi:hypothetical protein
VPIQIGVSIIILPLVIVPTIGPPIDRLFAIARLRRDRHRLDPPA